VHAGKISCVCVQIIGDLDGFSQVEVLTNNYPAFRFPEADLKQKACQTKHKLAKHIFCLPAARAQNAK
jgi:hypothetical protein